ncbi:MAG: LptA/OstA family protein [Rhodobacter sp.]|nr:LptA/OstA family protein [Rhodobacter sp.]
MRLSTAFRPIALGVWLVMSAAGACVAQGASVSLGVQDHDSSTPVEITSESLELDQESGMAVFTGDVLVKQGEITMTCQRMQVEYSEDPVTGKNEIKVIRMFGGVTFVSKEEAAESQRAVYTLTDDLLVMLDNVLVTQGVTALSADKLTYNLDTGDGRMEGSVKTVLQQN